MQAWKFQCTTDSANVKRDKTRQVFSWTPAARTNYNHTASERRRHIVKMTPTSQKRIWSRNDLDL